MNERQNREVEAIVARESSDENVVAVILIGSCARGDEREGSDVDYNLVVREKRNNCHVTKDELRFIRERANEPTRWSYTGAKVLFTRDPGIAGLIAGIPVFQEGERSRKMESFASQIRMHFSYLMLAEYSRNEYLLRETSAKIALFAGRLVLADNRVLYPNRKWFSRQIERVADKPDRFCEDMRAFLAAPSIAGGKAFIDGLFAHKAYPEPAEGWVTRFNDDSVFHWKTGTFSIEDW